jgi:hypothetical protein
VNSVGSSAYSSTFMFQPPAAPVAPQAPNATVSAVSVSAPTVTIAFAAPVTGVTYTVSQQSRTGGGTPWGAATVVATGVSGTSWTSGALTPDRQYRYSLVAVSSAGSSTNSGNSNAVTPRQLANAPTTPSAVNVTPVTTGAGTRSVVLTWSLGAPNGATVTGVRVVRANGATLAGGLATTNLGATATTTTVNGLARGATYTFQVQVLTAGGANGSSTVTTTTLP